MPEGVHGFDDRRNHVLDKLPALADHTDFGHKTMLTKSKREKNLLLLRKGPSADKKLCVFLVNTAKVHYNRSVKGFRKLELRVVPMHPL